MIKQNENSNAQAWELEVLCKNKKYLDKVVFAILEVEFIDFEVESVYNEKFEHRWTVLMFGNWFANLSIITSKLKQIEKELDGDYVNH